MSNKSNSIEKSINVDKEELSMYDNRYSIDINKNKLLLQENERTLQGNDSHSMIITSIKS